MPEPAATYWSYWGLRQAPFRAASGSALYHLSPTHEEALARLHFLVENRRRVGVLLGDAGSGKTLLLSRFVEEIRSQGADAALVAAYRLGEGDLLRAFASGLALTPRHDEPHHLMWARLTDHLVERRYQRNPAVLILDDADTALDQALSAVVRLLQTDSMEDPQLTFVLSIQSQNVARLGRRLLELIDLRIELEPWTVEETGKFVEETIAKAGQQRPLFEAEAVQRLQQLSGGRPRRVGQIADLALVAAAGLERSSIDAATIETVHRELAASAVR
jgi:type II secretory pathway predicted ATPase ExeA